MEKVMTKHAYIDGTPENPGHVYFEQDGARLRYELEPEDVLAALNGHMGRDGTAAEPQPFCRDREDGVTEPVWSEWLTHDGGPCPLPPDARVSSKFSDGSHRYGKARSHHWPYIVEFEYQCLPGGWVERGGFVPPASLWAEGSPVRCEWTYSMALADKPGTSLLGADDWADVTHIRLLPAKATSFSGPVKAEMPAGFTIERGWLFSPGGNDSFGLSRAVHRRFGTATILAAVKAWGDALGERG
jgi:hypothetical protein